MKVLKTLFAILTVLTWAVPALALERLPTQPPIPKNNPQTKAKIELGKMLFMDPRLSSSGTVSCNSCHNIMEGGDDDRSVSVGVGGQTGGRSAPTVYNAAFLSTQFWDGRAPSLEEQAKGPLLNPVEMGMKDHDAVMAVIGRYPEYRQRFEQVFGKKSLTIDNFAKAVAAFERTLITPNSPVDRYLAGDKKALSVEARKGMKLFTKIGCEGCHSGPDLAGPALPEGQGFFMKFPAAGSNKLTRKYGLEKDKGRQSVTGKKADLHMFRVPTLRNIALTAPYFHNGAVPTLGEAVRVMALSQFGKQLSDTEVRQLVAFLEGLTGEFPVIVAPRLPSLLGASTVKP